MPKAMQAALRMQTAKVSSTQMVLNGEEVLVDIPYKKNLNKENSLSPIKKAERLVTIYMSSWKILIFYLSQIRKEFVQFFLIFVGCQRSVKSDWDMVIMFEYKQRSNRIRRASSITGSGSHQQIFTGHSATRLQTFLYQAPFGRSVHHDLDHWNVVVEIVLLDKIFLNSMDTNF